MSTRPRITFDSDGRCTACLWVEQKQKIDWDDRFKQLAELLNRHRRNDRNFDCLVPMSGGKDGSYVVPFPVHESWNDVAAREDLDLMNAQYQIGEVSF